MKKFRLFLLSFIALVIAIVLVVLAPPVVFLATVWWNDERDPLPAPVIGKEDASRLATGQPREVIAIAPEPAAAEKQIADLIQRANREGSRITIAGARHSMGGHTMSSGNITFDMLPFRHMALDEKSRILTVGAGARWAEIIPYLDARGLAVAVMQANNDFTVGGSLSVNCHGWQPAAPPISSTVQAIRLITPDGRILRCSPTENAELFSLALGGYGLFGVILEAELRVIPNAFYRAKSEAVTMADYARRFRELSTSDDAGLAYGRLSVAPDFFLRDAVITVLRQEKTDRSPANTLTLQKPDMLKRLVFRGSVGSAYGKNLRWRLERRFGETAGALLSRNQIMNEPSEWFSNRNPAVTEVLHEYFVPQGKIAEFVERIRPVLLEQRPDLLNITIREVRKDEVTFLRYAREDVFAFVMLFHQRRDETAEEAMRKLTRTLIDEALACDGTYYLPYRPHATREQFHRAYPMATEFFARKRQLDPTGVFANEFFRNYGE
jgi:FAD/FMN-containing dehydrogenase